LNAGITPVRIAFSATDPNALLTVGGTSARGRLEVVLPTTGMGGAVDLRVTSSNGIVTKDYKVKIVQSSSNADLQSVVMGSEVLTENGGVYTFISTAAGVQNVTIAGAEGATVRLYDGLGQEITAGVTGAGTPLWSGTLTLTGDVNRYTIKATPASGDVSKTMSYTLVAQRKNFAVGLDDVQAAYGKTKPTTSGSGNITNDNWGKIPQSTVYDKAGNPFELYTVKVGATDQWVELMMTPMRGENTVTLGYQGTDGTNSTNGYFKQNGKGATGLKGTGYFTLNLDNLIWLDSMKETGANAKDFTSATFKEAFVPVNLTTHFTDGGATKDAYTKEYIIHLVRVNNDDSLRAIKVTPQDNKEQLFDNESTGSAPTLDSIKTVDANGNNVYRI
ncbi:MAG: hypothetical protein RRY53_07615, partial [Pseudoflavonifractor sp.]